MPGQSHKHSLMEVALNYAIGFGVAWTTSAIVLHAMGFKATMSDNFWITVVFTVVSLIRSYLVRRLFNHFHVKGIL